jgi:hypothetical protein
MSDAITNITNVNDETLFEDSYNRVSPELDALPQADPDQPGSNLRGIHQRSCLGRELALLSDPVQVPSLPQTKQQAQPLARGSAATAA